MKHIAKVLIFALMISLFCVGGASAANGYEGVWKYDDYTTWFDFDADGTWREYFHDGLAVDGYYEVSGDSLDVYLWDGTVWYIMDVDDDVMTDDDGDTLFPSELPDFEDSDLEDGGFTGVWEYTEDDESLWIQIYEAGRYMIYTESDGAYSVGEVRLLDDDTIGLYQSSDDSDDDAILELRLDNGVLIDEADEELVRSELPYSGDSGSDSDAAEGTGLVDSVMVGEVPEARTASESMSVGDVKTNDDTYSISLEDVSFATHVDLRIRISETASGHNYLDSEDGKCYAVLTFSLTNLSNKTLTRDNLRSFLSSIYLTYAEKYHYDGESELLITELEPLEEYKVCLYYEIPESILDDTDSLVASFTIDGDAYTVDCRAE